MVRHEIPAWIRLGAKATLSKTINFVVLNQLITSYMVSKNGKISVKCLMRFPNKARNSLPPPPPVGRVIKIPQWGAG